MCQHAGGRHFTPQASGIGFQVVDTVDYCLKIGRAIKVVHLFCAKVHIISHSHTEGSYNIAIGHSALIKNTTGSNNIAIGYWALYSNTTGSNNIGIGNNAQVPNSTGSNQVRIGNTSITYAGIQVAWTITSDRRLKKDIQNTALGLNFVNQLRPVSYIRKNDDQNRTEYGFIAQEVATALQQAGVATEGIINIDDKGMYSLRYNDFIAISVKAIQELSAQNEALKQQLKAQAETAQNETEALKAQVETDQNETEALKAQLNKEDQRLQEIEDLLTREKYANR